MDLAGVMQAVGALREARGGDGLGLEDPCVADSLQRLFPAHEINLSELDWRHRRSRVIDLVLDWPGEGGQDDDD